MLNSQGNPKMGNSKKWQHIDKHTFNTPSWAEESTQSLAAYLVQPARNVTKKHEPFIDGSLIMLPTIRKVIFLAVMVI